MYSVVSLKIFNYQPYWGGNSRRQVVNVFSTGFWGNGCEQNLNSHSQRRRRPAPQAIFFLRVGTKSYRVGERRVCVTLQRFFYMISDPLKRGVYVCCFLLLTRGWGRLETRPPVALRSSPKIFACTMSLAHPVHPVTFVRWWIYSRSQRNFFRQNLLRKIFREKKKSV